MKAEYIPPIDDVVVMKEEPGYVYIIMPGKVELIDFDQVGKEQISNALHFSDMFAEVGAICCRPKSYTYRIKTVTQLLRLRKKTLTKAMQDNNFLKYYGLDGGFNRESFSCLHQGPWRDILKVIFDSENTRIPFRNSFSKVVGNRDNILFWKDTWCSSGSYFMTDFPRLFALENNKDCKLADRWKCINGYWDEVWHWHCSPRGKSIDGVWKKSFAWWQIPWKSPSISIKDMVVGSKSFLNNKWRNKIFHVHHNVYSPPQSIPQLEYPLAVNLQPQQAEFPQLDLGSTVPVFKQGDDPIDLINHMMSFLSAVVTSRYPTTNNQLRNSSNPRKQATINDERVMLQPIHRRQISFATGVECAATWDREHNTWDVGVNVVYCSGVDTPLFDGMLVPQQAQDVEDAAEDEDAVNENSMNSLDPSPSYRPTKVEVSKELPKVSMAVEQHHLESKTFEIKMNKVLNENERLLKQVITKDIVNIVVNSSVDNASVKIHECKKRLELETELLNKTDFIKKETYDKLFRSYMM
nr:potassium channel AKT2/3 [Tanacetum cinerariifolium]